MKLYDKRGDFNFPIVDFPLIYSNIPATPAYGVYIYIADIPDLDFLDRVLLLARKLLNQRFIVIKLKSSLRKFYCPHHDLVNRYGISVSQMATDFPLVASISRPFSHSWLITEFVTRARRWMPVVEQELFTPPEHMSSSPVFSCLIFSFLCSVL